MCQRILVGLDDSEASRRAVDYCIDLAQRLPDISLVLVHVPEPVPRKRLEHGGAEQPAQEERMERRLEAGRESRMQEQTGERHPHFRHAQQRVDSGDVSEGRIEFLTAAYRPEEGVADLLAAHAREHGCETLAVGRSLEGGGVWGRRHGSNELLRACEDLTLWIVG